ncbi:DMT family transporter [Brachybacterium subflavum]|uniref:DMT family transporter n=1 Tax=Brachybacterium subflavum TaxID=2585206 RepID=UPI001266615D|nr:DMT family transporter [Brachybacterium subflavum]
MANTTDSVVHDRPPVARTASVGIFALFTVLAGMLSPMQSAVNGRLGADLGDGHLASIVSFGAGLVLMLLIILPRPSTRRAFLSLPRQLRRGTIPWPNFFAGLCGAMIVLSEGISVGALGVATFQTALISGMVISGVVCDRLGIGVPFKQALSVFRIIGAALAVVATVLVVSPNFETPHALALVILPFVGGLLAGWQPAGNSNIGKLAGSMLVSITWNFLVGFVILGLAFVGRATAGHATFSLPDTWWMYLGGPLGLASIALMALLVRRLGLLLLALASTAGQLVGSILIDSLIPGMGVVHVVTVLGALVALCASGVAMIPSRQVRGQTTPRQIGQHDGIDPDPEAEEVRS